MNSEETQNELIKFGQQLEKKADNWHGYFFIAGMLSKINQESPAIQVTQYGNCDAQFKIEAINGLILSLKTDHNITAKCEIEVAEENKPLW